MSDPVPVEASATTAARFPCRACGAMLQFAPGTSTLACAHCGAANEIAAPGGEVEEADLTDQLARLEREADTAERRIVKCDACAAEVEPPPNVTASDCPYCGHHLNATLLIERQIKPTALLPFLVTRPKADDSFRGWLASRWFAPSQLKRAALRENRLSGIYIPAWTYDAATASAYRGQRGDAYYVTVGSGKNQRRERRIRWTDVTGRVRLDFDDVLVLASKSLPERQLHQLEPWDLPALVPYDHAYLAGFRCECYQVTLPEGFEAAKSIMEQAIQRAIEDDIGGDEQRIDEVRTRWFNLTFKHILLPVWVSAYRFHGRVFRFLVNARTGEVQGERPWSAWKVVLAVIAGVLLVGLVLAIVALSR